MSRLNDDQTKLFSALSSAASGQRVNLFQDEFSDSIEAEKLSILSQIDGDNKSNFLTGTSNDDVIHGYIGNDTISGNQGDDYLDGGTDADQMFGGAGADTYVVDSQLDIVQDDVDQLSFDVVLALTSYALAENSEINSLRAFDPHSTAALVLTGSDATAYSYQQELIGNDGTNILDGRGGEDTLFGLGGNDFLRGGNSNSADYLDGGTGVDDMRGGMGSDVYVVDSKWDTVLDVAASPFDTDQVSTTVSYRLQEKSGIEYLSVADTGSTYAIDLTGSDSNGGGYSNGKGYGLVEILTGNDGVNTLMGLGSDDYLDGAGGDDILIGGTGNDSLYGYDGNDLLKGEGGNDQLTGGSGTDTFEFYRYQDSPGIDKVTDFNVVDDLIYLHINPGTGRFLTPEQFRVGTKALDADDRVIYNATTGKLFYDADGNGIGFASSFAILTNKPKISFADFFVFGM